MSLLDPADNDPLPGQHNPPPPLVIVDNVEEWHMEEILDSCIHRQYLQYLCHGAWSPRVARRVTQWLVTCIA